MSRRIGWVEWAIAGVVCLVAGAWVFGGALRYFFSQDDFQHLARAAGLIPRPITPFRPISNDLFFIVMRAVADLQPAAYHGVALVLHAVVCTLAYAYLRRERSAPAAAAGTLLFAAHPALYTALYWISAVNVLLGWAFALAALHLEREPEPRRWYAVPLFALALLSRESLVTLPLVVLVVRLHDRTFRWKDLVLLSLFGMAVLHAVAIEAWGLFGGSGGESAYAEAFGPHIIDNFLTYAGWAANFWIFTVRGVTDAVDTVVFPWAYAVIAIWIAGVLIPGLRRRGWLLGGAWFVQLLLPVLPLSHHTYRYYLYGPLLGGSFCLAAAFDFVADRRTRPSPHEALPRSARSHAGRESRPSKRGEESESDVVPMPEPVAAWITAAVLAIVLVINGTLLVHKNEAAPFMEELRADPIVDRAIIARHVAEDLGRTRLPEGVRLWFWSPTSIQRAAAEGRDSTVETYWEKNVRQAVFDGLGVRVLFPQVREVTFVRALAPAGDSIWYAVYRPDGKLGLASYAMLDSMIRAHAGR